MVRSGGRRRKTVPKDVRTKDEERTTCVVDVEETDTETSHRVLGVLAATASVPHEHQAGCDVLGRHVLPDRLHSVRHRSCSVPQRKSLHHLLQLDGEEAASPEKAVVPDATQT